MRKKKELYFEDIDKEVSVIIPCLNEEEFIGQCLESLISCNYDMAKVEILVVDGMSVDKSREIVESLSRKYPIIKLLDNPRKVTPSALNIGIKAANGRIIFRADAHAKYPKDYIDKCVKALNEYSADNVGGCLWVVPRSNTRMGKAIALTYTHYFGSGNAEYKVGKGMGPKYVDTVPFGCYRREIFDKIGFFNENLHRSQDIEFNNRLRRAGGKILLLHDLHIVYYIRSGLRSYINHNYLDGKWVIYPYIFVREPVNFRHIIPLITVTVSLNLVIFGVFSKKFRVMFLFLCGIYVLVNVIFSFQLAYKERNIALAPLCSFAFLVRHLAYGLGSLVALPKTLSTKYFLCNRLKVGKSRFSQEPWADKPKQNLL